jgi:hypothetical protein
LLTCSAGRGTWGDYVLLRNTLVSLVLLPEPLFSIKLDSVQGSQLIPGGMLCDWSGRPASLLLLLRHAAGSTESSLACCATTHFLRCCVEQPSQRWYPNPEHTKSEGPATMA